MKETGKLDFKAGLILALVFMVFGFMLSLQFKTTEMQKTIREERVENLSERLQTVEAEKLQLAQELEQLKSDGSHTALKAELARLQVLSGVYALHGQGIEIVLDDSKIGNKAGQNPNLYIIHDEDLLRVLNELRAAGAEAISLNDQRIVAMSEVRCAGPTVSVNNVRSAPPYVIRAIGNPRNLTSALQLRGGVVDTFKFWGIQVKISSADDLYLPAFGGVRNYEFARAVQKEGE